MVFHIMGKVMKVTAMKITTITTTTMMEKRITMEITTSMKERESSLPLTPMYSISRVLMSSITTHLTA